MDLFPFKKNIKINRKSGPTFNRAGVKYFTKFFQNVPSVKLKRLDLISLGNVLDKSFTNNSQSHLDGTIKYLKKIFNRVPVVSLDRDVIFFKTEIENEEIFPPQESPSSSGPDIVDLVVKEEIKPEVEIFSSWEITNENPSSPVVQVPVEKSPEKCQTPVCLKLEENSELEDKSLDTCEFDFELHKPFRSRKDRKKESKKRLKNLSNLDKCIECPICFKAFSTEIGLKRHGLKEHRPFVYRTQDAEGIGPVIPLKSEFQIQTQYKYVNGLKVYEPYKCTECSRIIKIPSPAVLQKHIEFHQKEHEGRKRSFICPICSKGYYNEGLLQNHTRWAHEEGSKLCPHCGLFLPNRTQFQYHLRMKHRVEAPFKCSLCPQRFASKASALVHEKLHERTQTTKNTLVCPHPQCLKVFASEMSLHTHRLYSHPKSLDHPCPEPNCGQMFGGKVKVRQHLKNFHSKKKGIECDKFKCPKCPREYSIKLSLDHHLLYKHSSQLRDFDHKCSFEGCHLSFRSSLRLQTHEKNHKDKSEKRYLCTTCGKGFKVKTHLDYHIYTHDSKRNFACKECEKSFKFPNHLTTHVKIYHNMNEQERVKYFQEIKERRKSKLKTNKSA